MIKTIIFDLDGTLIDSSRDIANAVNRLRHELNERPISVKQVIKYVGGGVTNLIEQAVIDDSEKAVRLRERLIRYYEENLIEETTVYPGISTLLDSLKSNYNLAVASNKPLRLSIKALEGLKMDDFFKVITGPETTGNTKPAPDMLNHVALTLDCRPDEVIVVGDSSVDIMAAKNFGCMSCAVTWGYNSYEALKESGADFIINEPLELLDKL